MRGIGGFFRTFVAVASLAAGLELRSPVQAQSSICPDASTIQECIESFREPTPGDPAEVAEKRSVARLSMQAEEDLKATPSGSSGDGSSVGSTTKDFSPLLSLAGLIFGDPVDDGQGNLAFDLNLRSCPKEDDCQRSFKLELLVKTDPQVSEVVKAALPEDTRDELAEKLAGAAGDDMTLAGSWSYTGGLGKWRFGRDIAGYRGDLADLVRVAVDRPTLTSKVLELNRLKNGLKRDCAESIEANRNRGATIVDELGSVLEGDGLAKVLAETRQGETSMGRARTLCRGQVAEFEAAQRDSDGLLDNLQAGAEAKLATAGLDLFGELLDNQPQLFVTASGRQVDDYFGSDEFALGVTFETGFANLNAVPKVRNADGKLSLSMNDYSKYVADRRKSIESGQRFAFSATFARLDGGTVDLSALKLESVENVDAERLSVSAAYSRYLYMMKDRPLRMDFKAQYDDISDDPTLQDRLVANLTFSVQAGEVEIPFGLVYANHSKYLGEVDEKVTAHIGLKFRGFGSGS